MKHIRSVTVTRNFPRAILQKAFLNTGVEYESEASYENTDRVILTVSGKAETIMNFYAIVNTVN